MPDVHLFMYTLHIYKSTEISRRLRRYKIYKDHKTELV